MIPTTAFCAFGIEPFPTIEPGDNLAAAITTALRGADLALQNGDILIIASKVVSIAEKRYVDLGSVTPSPEALELSARTGKPAPIVQLILDESVTHFVAGTRGPIIATHRLGYRLTSAGVDRAGTAGAWLLPADPDASARALRVALTDATGTDDLAVVIADSDGRADRRGATVISIGAAGIAPLRVSENAEGGRTKHQEETLTDMVAAAGGLILGQRGRGAPVAVLRGLQYERSDEGVASMLHRVP